MLEAAGAAGAAFSAPAGSVISRVLLQPESSPKTTSKQAR
jgi:hypothetical protein